MVSLYWIPGVCSARWYYHDVDPLVLLYSLQEMVVSVFCDSLCTCPRLEVVPVSCLPTVGWLQDLLSKVVFYFLIKIYTLYNFKTNKFMIHIFQVFLASVQRRPSCAAVLVASDRVSWGQSGDSHVLSYTCRVKKASWLSSVWFKESSPHTDSSFATYVRNLQVSFENEICLDFADR